MLNNVSTKLLFLTLSLLVGSCVSPDADSTDSRVLQDCDSCPKLVRIDAGVFNMGTARSEIIPTKVPAARLSEEKPVHRVHIDYSFAIGQYEISISEFALFADETGFKSEGCFILEESKWVFNPAANWRNPGFDVTDAHPATCLSYDEFAAYLQWLSAKTGQTYRFPTEAEWEYVARLGIAEISENTFFGSSACQYLNGADTQFKQHYSQQWAPGIFECDDGYAASSPVDSYLPNQLGIYGVFGNVSEWTQDCSGSSHDGAPVDGSARLLEPCPTKVLKGGSWAGGPGFLRSAIRGGFPVALRGDGHGLRVVREVNK